MAVFFSPKNGQLCKKGLCRKFNEWKPIAACAVVQSDQALSIHSTVFNYLVTRLGRSWPDCVETQADPNLESVNLYVTWRPFSHVATHNKSISDQNLSMNIYQRVSLYFLHISILEKYLEMVQLKCYFSNKS